MRERQGEKKRRDRVRGERERERKRRDRLRGDERQRDGETVRVEDWEKGESEKRGRRQ